MATFSADFVDLASRLGRASSMRVCQGRTRRRRRLMGRHGSSSSSSWRCPCDHPPRSDRPRFGLKPLGPAVRRGSEDTHASIETDDGEQPMLWSRTQDRRLNDPERQLLDAIAAGALDEHLLAIADAVHARGQLLHTVRSARAIAEVCVGDRVMFTNRIRPRYLEHELAEVTELDDRTVTVRLWRPVGRFGGRELRCPPLALRKLDRETSISHS
jgi:hypothetical protein